ncbi:hypothetical protein Q7P35_005566 [Cladosporium inversicolor]
MNVQDEEQQALQRLENHFREVEALLDHGQFAEAERRMRQVAEESSQMFGLEDRKAIAAEHVYISTLSHQSRHEEAAEKQERLMALLKKTYGKYDDDTLEVAGALAQTWLAQGKTSESKKVATKLLHTQETLAKISYLEGNFTEAAEIQHRILQYAISRDEKPRKKAKAYCTYGITLMAQGKLNDSKPHLMQALDLSMESFGPKHLTTLTYQSDFALLHDELGEYQTAVEIESKVLEIRASVLGEKHPSTIETMGKRATFLFHAGQDKKAEEQLDRAVGLVESCSENYDPGMANVLANAACIYRLVGRYTTARELSCQAYNAMKHHEGEDSHAYQAEVRKVSSIDN